MSRCRLFFNAGLDVRNGNWSNYTASIGRVLKTNSRINTRSGIHYFPYAIPNREILILMLKFEAYPRNYRGVL